jgi:hypothetical protein
LEVEKMATPLEQARYRKLIYGGAIILLFTGLVVYRQMGVVEQAAERHGISETNIGKTDLGGSVARFLLASFRGPLICSLWWEAIELQARHEWDQMEIIIKSLTKLQPHFRSTWEYQGWNLAYNVSVEFDRTQDKYFYISEGIRWIARGEEINRASLYDPDSPSGKRIVGDPSLRWSIGFYLQNKMSVADEVKTYRCYLPLSCTPPKDWDPYEFRRDPQRLKDFKRDYPHIVERIRDLKHLPEEAEAALDKELQDFLTPLFRPGFPSLYPDQLIGQQSGLLGRVVTGNLDKFPVWPQPDPLEVIPPRLRQALDNLAPERPEDQDSYEISRLWFEYSCAPLPPPNVDLEKLDPDRRRLYRRPQRMVSLIFRSNPARSKSKMAERLAQEGWIEESRKAWADAHEMWREFGRENQLDLDPEEEAELRVRATRFGGQFPMVASGREDLPTWATKDEEILKDMAAYRRLQGIMGRQEFGNYRYWKVTSETYSRSDGIEVWRHLFNAKNRFKSDLWLARDEYETALDGWMRLLVTDKGRAEALLGLAPFSLNAGAVFQSRPFFELTPFGQIKQTHGEIAPFHEEYIALRARCDAPHWLRAGCDLWHLCQFWTHQAAAGGSLIGPIGCLPNPQVPLRLSALEITLLSQPGPLDLYLDEQVLESKRMQRPKLTRPEAEQQQTQRPEIQAGVTPLPQ